MDTKMRPLSRREMLKVMGAVAASAALAACAPAAPAPAPAANAPAAKPEATAAKAAAPAKEPIVIRFHGRQGEQGDHFDHFAEIFNKENGPAVTVKTENFPGADYYKKLNTLIAGGTVGDAFWIYLGGGWDQYAASGIYADHTPMVDSTSYDLKQFYPEAVEGCKMNGKLYGLPWCLHFGCGNILYYNKPMLDKAGVAYPDEKWTYDDLLAAAKKLTNSKENVYGFLSSTGTCAGPIHFPRAWGGDVTDPTGKKCIINEPKAVQGLQVLSDMFHVDKVSPLPSQVQVGTYQMFAANKLAMYVDGFWGKQVGDFVKPDVWAAAPSPKGPAGRGHVFYIDINAVTANSKHPVEAFKYLTYLSSHDAGMDIYLVRKAIPGARPDVWESPEAKADPHFQAAAWTVKEGIPPRQYGPANFRDSEYLAALSQGLDPIWLGEAKLSETIDKVAQAGQAVLDKPTLQLGA